MSTDSGALTYRTTFSRVIAVLVIAVCVVAVVTTGLTDPSRLLRTWPYGVVAAVSWVAFWRPYARIDDDGVVMANVLRSVRLPWAAVTGIDSRWAFTIETADRKHSSWAVPARSGMAARSQQLRRRGSVAEPELQGNDAAAAALEAADRLERWQERADDGPAQVRTSWNLPEAAVLVAALVWAAVGLIV